MRSIVVLPVFLVAAACAPVTEPADTSSPDGTGARLTVDYFGDTDVIGFHLQLDRVACDAYDAFEPNQIHANVNLLDGIMPGMVSVLEQSFDPDTRHLGADLFVSLEPGCYDVIATPSSAFTVDSYTPSLDCSTATDSALQVVDGQTTETLLVSQCVGDEMGAIDVAVAMNHAPVISVSIDEKFNYECEPVNVCATAYDVDDDPIEFVWTNNSSTAEFSINVGPVELVGFEEGHRIWEQCTEIVTRFTTSYDFDVTVYDLGIDAGQTVRMEDVVDGVSNDDLHFPIHTNWIEEPLCFDGDDNLVSADGVSIERAAGCDYTDAEEYYCDMYGDDPIAEYLCDASGNLIEEALYPVCD